MCGWEYLVYDCGCEIKGFCSSEDPCDAVRDDPFDGKCTEEWSIGGIHVHEICATCRVKDEALQMLLRLHARVDAAAAAAIAEGADQMEQHESVLQETDMPDVNDAARSEDSGYADDEEEEEDTRPAGNNDRESNNQNSGSTS